MTDRFDNDRALAQLAQLTVVPELFPHRLDLVGQRVLLLEMNESAYREAAFLDERAFTGGQSGFWLGLAELARRLEAQPVIPSTQHFIFHIGHCGSTLLSRLLPEVADVLPLREPQALRDLAASARLLAEPTSRLSPSAWQRLFDNLLDLLSRSYLRRQAVLVKATSDCSNLIGAVLSRRADTRAVLMFQSLERYLAAMLGGANAHLDIEGHAVSRLGDLLAYLGEPAALRLYELTPVQRIVVSWLAGVASFQTALQAGGKRLLTLDFDVLLADTATGLGDIAIFFGLATEPARLAATVSGPVMNRYAKAPEHVFSPARRAAQLTDYARRFEAEIRAGMAWADTLTARFPALAPLRETFRGTAL
jgi:hypothetical protein